MTRGSVDGQVKQGRFRRPASGGTFPCRSACVARRGAPRATSEAVAVLEAYLDRIHGPDGAAKATRAGSEPGRSEARAPSGAMPREEALAMLGLKPGASEARDPRCPSPPDAEAPSRSWRLRLSGGPPQRSARRAFGELTGTSVRPRSHGRAIIGATPAAVVKDGAPMAESHPSVNDGSRMTFKPVRKAIFPGRRPRHPLSSRHQGHAEGNAAGGRPAADPICGGGGEGGRHRAVHLRHRPRQDARSRIISTIPTSCMPP